MPDRTDSIRSNSVLADRLRVFGGACSVVVATIGLCAVLGWILHDDALKGVYAGKIGVKTNTAICLVLGGLASLVRGSGRKTTAWIFVARLLAAIVTVVGLATLVEHLSGWDFGIDQLLFRDERGAAGTLSPNRMGIPASVCFPLLGSALLLFDRKTSTGRAPSQVLAIAALLIALVPILGYVFSVRQLYGIAGYTGIALHTAIAFVLLALSILCAHPEFGPMRLLVADNSGGLLVRRLLPAAVLLPIVLGWLRVMGEDAGFYDVNFGRTLLVFSFIVVFSWLTWWTGSVVSRHATARVRAEAAESQMKERLMGTLESERRARAVAEHSNRMKEEFLATLSHELRTPLHAILGWAQVLARIALPSDARRGVESIERNSRLQAQLIEDLLDMSRIESGKVVLDVQEVELPLLIEAALAAAAPAAAAKDIRIERIIEPGVRPIRGDPARLQQVLWNVVSNAIKFTPNEGRVTVSLGKAALHVEIKVRDSGIGISPDLLEPIFDRFRQANASTTRPHGGLGLGLTIARQLAELHGGTVFAESAGEGLGSTFTIRLPTSPSMQPHPSGAPGSRAWGSDPVPASGTVLDGVRVLAVDDQPDALQLIERVLRERSAEVTVASSAEDALGLLEGGGVFDILVSDIGMPGRDGYELIETVRTRLGTIPAIALTAYVQEGDRQRAIAAGFQLHLAKPIRPDELIAAVASLAARHEADDDEASGAGESPKSDLSQC